MTWDTVQGNGASITGGSGTWSNGGVNWNTGAGDTVWSNANPDTATFGGAAGTATLGSNITAGAITFSSAGYTIAQDGGNAFALTIGTGGVILSGGSATINAKLTGANNWDANWGGNGGSSLTIGGSVANDSTGTISVTLPSHLILAKSGGVAATAGNIVLNNNPMRLEVGDQSIGGTVSFLTSFNARLHPRSNTFTTRGLVSANGNVGVIENSGLGAGGGGNSGPDDRVTGTGTIKIVTQAGDNWSYGALIRNGDGANSGTLAFIKEGDGTQTFVGTNALLYTGATTINGGTLKISIGNAVSGWASAVAVGANSTLELNSTGTANVDSTFFGVSSALDITGTGTVTKTGTGYLGFLFNSPTSGLKNFQGTIDVQQGILGSNGTAWASGAGLMDLNIASGATFDIRTGNLKIDGLSGGGTAKITSSHNVAVNLSLGNNNGNATYDGSINNGSFAPIAGASNTGVISLTKVGTGTQTLTSASTYSGGTTIDGGTLKISNASGSATGSGPVTVNANGTLSGTGSIVGGTVSLFGTVSPGNSVGTLFADIFNWQGGGTYDWEVINFGGAPGAGYDFLDLTGGNLTFVGGGPFNVDIDASAIGIVPVGNYVFEIARANSVVNFNALNFALTANGPGNGPAHATWSIFQQGNSVYLQATVTPEPSSLVMFAIVGLVCIFSMGMAARRRSQCQHVYSSERRRSDLLRK